MNLGGEVELQDEAISLSAATLAALREFAMEKGVTVGGSGGDSCKKLEESESAVDIVRAVQQHFDVKDKETVFHITHGDISLELLGLKRELGQTLDSTGLTIWRAADHLCEYLFSNPDLLKDKYICELGCGLGVVAILVDKLNVNATIVATDGDDKTVDLLTKNMNSNTCSVRLVSRKLWWSENKEDNEAFLKSLDGVGGSSSSSPQKFDLILAADVIYDEEAVLPLAASAAGLLARPGGEIILGFSRRNVPISKFWDAIKRHGLEWEKIKDCGSEAGRDNEAIYRLFWQENII